MRGWDGALRRYSEPSRSLRRGEKFSNETDMEYRYHSPHQAGKEGKQMRKKGRNPNLGTGLSWT